MLFRPSNVNQLMRHFRVRSRIMEVSVVPPPFLFFTINGISYHHRPNSFVMITANRVLHCNADTPEEMHHWITLLQRSKGDTRVDGQEFIIRGANTIILHFSFHCDTNRFHSFINHNRSSVFILLSVYFKLKV